MQPKPSDRMQNASMNISYTNRQVDDFTTFGQSYMIRCSGIRIFLFYCFFFFQFDNSSVVSSPLVSILRSILCCYFFFLYAYSPPYSLRSAYTWHLVVKHVFDSVGERENQFERRALTHTHIQTQSGNCHVSSSTNSLTLNSLYLSLRHSMRTNTRSSGQLYNGESYDRLNWIQDISIVNRESIRCRKQSKESKQHSNTKYIRITETIITVLCKCLNFVLLCVYANATCCWKRTTNLIRTLLFWIKFLTQTFCVWQKQQWKQSNSSANHLCCCLASANLITKIIEKAIDSDYFLEKQINTCSFRKRKEKFVFNWYYVVYLSYVFIWSSILAFANVTRGSRFSVMQS